MEGRDVQSDQQQSAQICFNQSKGSTDGVEVANQDPVIQVMHSNVQPCIAKVLSQKERPKRIALLNASARFNNPFIKLQPGRPLVAPSCPPCEGRKRVPDGRKDGIAADRVEGIGEVKLEGHLVRGGLASPVPGAHNVNDFFVESPPLLLAEPRHEVLEGLQAQHPPGLEPRILGLFLEPAGVCSNGFSVLPAATVGCAKDTLGEHAKLTPSFVIIAIAAKARVKTWAHAWRAALGTCRMVAVLAACEWLKGMGVCIDVGLHRCDCRPARARAGSLRLRLSRRKPFPPSRCAGVVGPGFLASPIHPVVRPSRPGLKPLLMVTGPPTVPTDRRRARTPRQQRVPNNRWRQFLPLVVQCFRDSEPLTPAEGARKLAGAWAGCSADRWPEPPQAGKLGTENEDGHREQEGQSSEGEVQVQAAAGGPRPTEPVQHRHTRLWCTQRNVQRPQQWLLPIAGGLSVVTRLPSAATATSL
eukprot:s3076_g13.t1